MKVFNHPARYLIARRLRLASLCVWLSCTLCYAQQEGPKQQADHLFYAQDYPSAAASYADLIKDRSLAGEARKDVLFNLAYAYKELGDFAKAESSFRQLLELGEPTGKNKVAYLYYAQALGHNGKMKDAQDMYARYENVKATLGTEPSNYRPGAVGKGDVKVTYRVERLGINTDNAEFSPAYFREGLVYVAGKGSSGASTSPDKGYLDLFYVPNRNDLTYVGVIGTDGKLVATDNGRASAGSGRYASRRLGYDSYTSATANDSHTAASFAPLSFSEGLDMGKSNKKNMASFAPEEFSQDLNTKYHEGPVTFSADGSKVIFTRNNYNGGKSSKSSDNVTKLKLYTAELRDGGWVTVQELPFNSDEYSTGHPALSRDGKSLYFVSDRPGGRGGTDVYLSRWENGSWSQPLNMGPEINTKGDEMFPFVDENGNFYFASNGRSDGFGGLDIYFIPLGNGANQLVSHLEAPINSRADDFGLIADGSRSTGYFSSNRLNGDDDIFRFIRESSLYGCRNLSLKVFDEVSYAPLDNVTVTVRARGEGRDEQVLETDAEGMIDLCLEAENDFLFELAKDGYLTGTLGFSTVGLTDDRATRLGSSLIKFEFIENDRTPGRVTSGGNTDSEWDSDDAISASTLRGTVTGEADKKPIEGVKIVLKNECDGKVKQTVTGPNGRFRFELQEGCDYTLVASKSSYGTNTNAIKRIPAASKPKLVSANLIMIKAGDLVTLDNIHYDTGKWEVRPDAARELDRLVATMTKYPSLRIEIGSHTDSQGDAKLNQYLSERRAKAALNYLASKGVTRDRLSAKGYGETRLINQCEDGVLCTEEEHERNRRTELKVLSIR
ncbi:carboxypeptidase regulatory-like domain-containing protein [Persicitalea sp.]|uniref:OmpA family protein n=1 Tax=Persicitalea sp. TaxID=3100273 RepID=UPI00359470CB